MRIALVPHGRDVNTAYRSILPLFELANRGHQAEEVDWRRPVARAAVRQCDLLHIHRWCEQEVVKLAQVAKASGAAVVWDDDDDSLRPQKNLSRGNLQRGRAAAIRLAARRRLFGIADLVTTTTPTLAEIFRADGARTVQVIENYVMDGVIAPRRPHSGLLIGWYGLEEHKLELDHIPLVEALEDLLEAHSDVHVTTVGVPLRGLRHERYQHRQPMGIEQLMQLAASFDVGLAPLSPEVRINPLRSSIKVKEYAALGVPWLASPIGPYARLGEREGGRLVADDRWFEELDALVRDERARRKLAQRAESWGFSQRLSRNLDQWERAFRFAVGQARRAA
jgi:glycosyltransferase involved in cell wall biosynthesis